MAAVQAARTATQRPKSTDDHLDQQPGGSLSPKPSTEPIITLHPLIDDILRTRYCVPGSVFLVEDVQTAALPGSGRWHALQLLLSDGHLCIQALLGSQMHRFVQTGEITVGSYVQLNDFIMRWERVDRTGEGQHEGEDERRESPRHMVYLVVEDIVTIGRHEAFLGLWRSQVHGQEPGGQSGTTSADAATVADKMSMPPPPPGTVAKGKRPAQPSRNTTVERAFDYFDALTYPLKISPRKSQKLPEPVSTAEPKAHEPPTAAGTLGQATLSSPSKRPPVSLPRDWHNLQSPLKLTTLHSIPHLPYAQGWSCNILAIVVSLSPVEPSYLPPHRQRTARLADPSTAKQVHLAVFLDPEQFEPTVGSAVLLVGVKNHPFDGGSLKKYASDGAAGAPGKGGTAATGKSWWYEDPWELGWCDVAGIKDWWAEVEKVTSSNPLPV